MKNKHSTTRVAPTAESVKQTAKNFGADLVGIASTEVLAYLPPEHNPKSIHSNARSVIVIGKKILRGSLRGIEQRADTRNSYQNFSLYGLEDNFLAKATYDLCIWFERAGFEAVPLFAYETDGQPVGVPVAAGKPAPNIILPYRIMAQAAGLGETALNGLFLTPQYGPRQRFAMLVSDAELEPDTPFTPYICDNCAACIKACTLQALSSESRRYGLKGYERAVAIRDDQRCRRCKDGAVQTDEGRFNTVDRVPAACGLSCIEALEQRGILQATS